ncbi:YggS family pyridoxal phosphate-dependent enzyme, partial [Candidatus Hydrogenedentota bacterium]
MGIVSSLDSVRERMERAARGVGRDPDDVTLVAVTKTVGTHEMETAIAHGVAVVGENRVEIALEKYGRLEARAEWHMIGHLQRRKVRDAVRIFDWIHSVDSIALAKEIDKRCAAIGKVMPALIEVNVSGEESKYGLLPNEIEEALRAASVLDNIRVEGLMTMAPFFSKAEETRPVFRGLRELAKKTKALGIENVSMKHLSM